MPATDACPPSPTPPPDAFRLLLDEVGAFVYTTDLQGRYTYANRLVLDLLGVAQLQEVLGRLFSDVVPLDEQADAALRAADARVLHGGEILAREESHPVPGTGELRTYWSIKKPLRDAQGHIVGLIGISHDITAKKRLEDQVHQQNVLLDAVLNGVDALVYMKDAERRFVYANQNMARAFGQPVQAIVGRRDTDFLPGRRQTASGSWTSKSSPAASATAARHRCRTPAGRCATTGAWSCPAPRPRAPRPSSA